VARGHPGQHERGVRAGRRQRAAAGERAGRQLPQQGADVQRVPGGVGPEPGGRRDRHRLVAQGGGQRADRRRVEARDLDAPAGGVGQADEALRQPVDPLGPGGDAEQHPVGAQPPGAEGQRVERRAVGPVGVVDADDQRRPQLQAVDEAQQAGAGLERVGAHVGQGVGHLVAPERRRPQQLLDEAEVELGLTLVAGRGHGDDVGDGQQAAHELGLAHARLADDEQHRRLAGRRPLQSGAQGRQLSVAPD